MIRSIVAAFCFLAGVVCLWLISRAWVQDPWVIVGLFGGGVLLGIAAGVLSGRVIRDRLLRGKRTVLLIIILSLLNFGVFTFLGRPVPTENATARSLIVSALLLVAAPLLVTLSAYLLGFLLLPGSETISRSRALRSTVPLYASILAGVVLGFQSGLWQRGTVPLEPFRPPVSHEPPMTWREALAALGGSFPPEISSKGVVKAERDRRVPPPAEARSATREVVILETSWIMAPGHSTVREVIEATGPVVTVGGDRVEFVGYAMIPPDPTGAKELWGEGSETTYWDLAGEPLEDPLLVDLWHAPAWRRNNYMCVALWNLSRRYPFDGSSNVTLTQLPWNLRRGAPTRMLTAEGAYSIGGVPLPAPGPAEVRLRTFVGDPNVCPMPAREGEILDLETNRLLVAGLYPRPVHRVSRRTDSSIEIEFPTADELEAGHSEKNYTTAVFCCALEAMIRGLHIEAVLESGESVSPSKTSLYGHFLVCRYEAKMDEIREFQVLEVPGTADIRFLIPELRGLPPENEGVTNRLDLTYASLQFTGISKELRFLEDALGDRFSSRRYGTDISVSAGLSRYNHKNATVRDVLNGTYPGRWWVSKGIVCTTGDRFGPIVWKTRWAARKMSGG